VVLHARPYQFRAANTEFDTPKVPTLAAHWYAATSVQLQRQASCPSGRLSL